MKIKGVSVKLLFGNVTMLNMILLVTGVLFLLYLLLPQYRVNIFSPLPFGKKNLTYDKTETMPSIPSISEFAVIGDQNLFHPERKIPKVIEIKADGKPLPMPEYVLYGTLVSDSVSIAYLEDSKDPRNTPGRGKRQITLHKGDTLSGFTLKEIYVDKIVMARGDDKITVSVYDSHNKIKKGLIAKTSPVKGAVAQAGGVQDSATSSVKAPAQTSSPKQPQALNKADPPRRMIDQDVFNFFEKRKQK